MSNKTRWIAGTLVLAVLGMGTVHAGDQGCPGRGHGGGMALLKSADANADGSTTVAEAQAKLLERSTAMDSNKDGAISVDEVEAFHQARRAERRNARFAAMDVDKNGSVSVAEFTAGHAERLTRMDSNKDGVLDNNDRGQGQGQGQGRGRGDGHGHGHGYGHEQN